MLSSLRSVRTAAAGAVGVGALAGAMLFGGAPAAQAAPAPAPATSFATFGPGGPGMVPEHSGGGWGGGGHAGGHSWGHGGGHVTKSLSWGGGRGGHVGGFGRGGYGHGGFDRGFGHRGFLPWW